VRLITAFLAETERKTNPVHQWTPPLIIRLILSRWKCHCSKGQVKVIGHVTSSVIFTLVVWTLEMFQKFILFADFDLEFFHCKNRSCKVKLWKILTISWLTDYPLKSRPTINTSNKMFLTLKTVARRIFSVYYIGFPTNFWICYQ
jgi:hypothetical protein